MKRHALWLALVLGSGAAGAANVTTPEARKRTLLEYVDERDDLGAAEKKDWDKALRLAFGGAAIKDGSDEGITVAKSVVAAAIFFDVEPKRAARAAFDAYHDTYRFVPPPIAINYQILVLQGRKPAATARQLAFDFPRYFNQEIAPDLAVWWDEMLAAGAIPALERRAVEAALAATRELMRPMLRERLWRATELEARQKALAVGPAGPKAEVKKALTELSEEIGRDFKGVGRAAAIRDPGASFYDRYAALCVELQETPKPRPSYVAAMPAPKATPQAEAQKLPVPPPPPRPVDKPAPPMERPAPPTEKPVPPPVAPRPPPDAVIEEARDAAVSERQAQKFAGHVPAPFSGDPLVAPFGGWPKILNKTVDRWVGTPYLWGGVSHRGIDCSGFTRQVFREAFSVELPRNSREQFATGAKVERPQLKAGDLVFFDTMDRGTVTHVGVYLGDGMFAHASSSKGVTRADLAAKYHQRAFWGSRRLLRQ
ncbi:MAG: C40 family peptidase [Deltaproteobacteria bacterium]|nr:C40 family peptidase [Deltaproteobacteria bacterium]